MTTYRSSHKCEMYEAHEDIIIVHYEPNNEIQENELTLGQQALQWFGRLSAMVLGSATFAPNALHISAELRPWVFVIFIFWVTALIMGVFNP